MWNLNAQSFNVLSSICHARLMIWIYKFNPLNSFEMVHIIFTMCHLQRIRWTSGKLKVCEFCGPRKYPYIYLPYGRALEILRGGEGGLRSQYFNRKYETKLEFLRGGSKANKICMESYEIFRNNAFYLTNWLIWWATFEKYWSWKASHSHSWISAVPERLFGIINSCHHFTDPALKLILTVGL